MASSVGLLDANIVAVKVGSNFLVDDAGSVNHNNIARLVKDIQLLVEQKKKTKKDFYFILVASGAVAAGLNDIKSSNKKNCNQTERKAAAAVGQVKLLKVFAECFANHNLKIAQVLLNFDDTENRSRYLQARSMMLKLLTTGHILLINENDSVGVAASSYGDNDRLAARVSTMLKVDLLLLLSDVDGFYSKNPALFSDAVFMPYVKVIDKNHKEMAKDAIKGSRTSGGMRTKIEAAEIATRSNCKVVIAKADVEKPIFQLVDSNNRYTLFDIDKASSLPKARKSWIGGTLNPKGKLVLDAGAIKAIIGGKSLLFAGLVEVQGTFERNDPVELLDSKGAKVAIGLTNYTSLECDSCKGIRSERLEKIFGVGSPHEIVHRDNMVVVEQ